MSESASSQALPPADPAVFAKNLAALERTQAAFARAVKSAPSLAPHAVATPDGGYSVRTDGAASPASAAGAASTAGAWVASRRAPLAEAVRLANEPQPKALQAVLVTGM